MTSAVQSFKLIKKIKDEKFDVDHLHQYALLLSLGARDFQVGVLEMPTNRFILLEDYIFHNLTSSEDQLLLLKGLFESHHILGAGFWKTVLFTVKNNQFVHVPLPLFAEEAAADYLRFNAKTNPASEVVLHSESSRSHAATVFALYGDLHQWILETYKHTTVQFNHQSACFLEGVLSVAPQQGAQPLYVYVDRFKLHIAAVENGDILYYNQFIIRQFSDYVKYIMLVLKALQMDQQHSGIVLWGYIGKNSPHALEFSKYIRNVVFGERPRELKFGYLFDEVQDHHFFDLYGSALLAIA